MRHPVVPGVISAALLGFSGVSAEAQVFLTREEIATPAALNSEGPSLAMMPDGRVLMSWIETDGPVRAAVKTAVLDGSDWLEPVTVVEGDDIFINYADFPAVAALPDGTLATSWSRMSGDSYYAYDTVISLSHDGGVTWSAGTVPHQDRSERQHGFLSMVSDGSGGITTMWLDGQNYDTVDTQGGAEGDGDAMQLRATTLSSDGALSEEILLDERTCSCCQTSAVALDDRTILLAYRDRTKEEIRDISLVRQVDGTWSKPVEVSGDGWEISGCPVNGPAIDAHGSQVALVWFTAADDIPAVRMAFSDDRGVSFGEARGIDLGAPFGGVDVVQLSDGSALFSWVEQTAAGETVLVCRATPTEGCGTPAALTLVRAGRTIGFPRMVASGGDVWIAWNETLQNTGGGNSGALVVRLVHATVELAR